MQGIKYLQKIVDFVRGVVAEGACFVVSRGPDEFSQLVHKMPRNLSEINKHASKRWLQFPTIELTHVVPILALDKLDITDRALGAHVDLLRLVHG